MTVPVNGAPTGDTTTTTTVTNVQPGDVTTPPGDTTQTGTPGDTTTTAPPQQPVFDPTAVQFGDLNHTYDTSSLGIPQGSEDIYNSVLDEFHGMGLSQENAFKILAMGMKPNQGPTTPQEALAQGLDIQTKRNYQNIVAYANNLGLNPEYLQDPKSVLVIQDMMGKINGVTHTGQPKVQEIPNNNANVESLTPDQAKAQYTKFVTESARFTTEERHKKMDDLIAMSTDKELTRAMLEIYR